MPQFRTIAVPQKTFITYFKTQVKAQALRNDDVGVRNDDVGIRNDDVIHSEVRTSFYTENIS